MFWDVSDFSLDCTVLAGCLLFAFLGLQVATQFASGTARVWLDQYKECDKVERIWKNGKELSQWTVFVEL